MTRMRLALTALGLLAGACAAHGGGEAARSASENAARIAAGRAIAETQCVGCHAIGADGESHNPQAPAFRTLAERYPGSTLDDILSFGLLEGHPAMPDFGFDRTELDAITAYLRSVQERQIT